MFPKIVGFSPQIILFFIGFSIIFTIHFGVFPPIFGSTPIWHLHQAPIFFHGTYTRLPWASTVVKASLKAKKGGERVYVERDVAVKHVVFLGNLTIMSFQKDGILLRS